jgi:hypothetical protein
VEGEVGMVSASGVSHGSSPCKLDGDDVEDVAEVDGERTGVAGCVLKSAELLL